MELDPNVQLTQQVPIDQLRSLKSRLEEEKLRHHGELMAMKRHHEQREHELQSNLDDIRARYESSMLDWSIERTAMQQIIEKLRNHSNNVMLDKDQMIDGLRALLLLHNIPSSSHLSIEKSSRIQTLAESAEQLRLLQQEVVLLRAELISMQHSHLESLKYFTERLQRIIRMKYTHR